MPKTIRTTPLASRCANCGTKSHVSRDIRSDIKNVLIRPTRLLQSPSMSSAPTSLCGRHMRSRSSLVKCVPISLTTRKQMNSNRCAPSRKLNPVKGSTYMPTVPIESMRSGSMVSIFPPEHIVAVPSRPSLTARIPRSERFSSYLTVVAWVWAGTFDIWSTSPEHSRDKFLYLAILGSGQYTVQRFTPEPSITNQGERHDQKSAPRHPGQTGGSFRLRSQQRQRRCARQPCRRTAPAAHLAEARVRPGQPAERSFLVSPSDQVPTTTFG